MADLKNFTLSSARPLPVIILADVSGSMSENGKINVLNQRTQEMIQSFADASSSRVEIQVCIITFGGESAKVHQDLSPAARSNWVDMAADGKTPMGSAFLLAKNLIEDRNRIPGRAYTPAVVLISDGKPTREDIPWQEALNQLLQSERASKAARFALAIGDEGHDVLKAFLADPNAKVFLAHEVGEIHRFFRYVTMSVTARSRSNNPNEILPTDPDDFEY